MTGDGVVIAGPATASLDKGRCPGCNGKELIATFETQSEKLLADINNNEALIEAASDGDIKKVKQLIENGAEGKAVEETILQEAQSNAQQYGYVVVVKYKTGTKSESFKLGGCYSEAKIQEYFNSPHCHDPKIVYDARSESIFVTEKDILQGQCNLCSNKPTETSFDIGLGNEFYFCPNCGKYFCTGCYNNELPLTEGSTGYGMCTTCDYEVQRAIPGDYGKIPLNSMPVSEKAKQREGIPDDELDRIMQDFLKRTDPEK